MLCFSFTDRCAKICIYLIRLSNSVYVCLLYVSSLRLSLFCNSGCIVTDCPLRAARRFPYDDAGLFVCQLILHRFMYIKASLPCTNVQSKLI